jgi:hypothetical protein
MRDVAVLTAGAVLAATFGWAGTTKLARAERWRQDIRAYRLSRIVRALAFLLVPWIEIGVAAAVLAGRWDVAAAVALGLLLVFSFTIVRLRLLLGTNELSCGCFGGMASRDYRLLLLRNLAVGAAALMVLSFFDEVGMRGRMLWQIDIFPAILVALGIAAIVWILWRTNLYMRDLPHT